MTVADLYKIPDVMYRRSPKLRDRECTFFFDEIQNIYPAGNDLFDGYWIRKTSTSA